MRHLITTATAAAVALLAACGVAIAWDRVPTRLRRLGSSTAALLATALLARGLLSLAVDGGVYDVFDAYRIVGSTLRAGSDVFVEPALGLANYPPLMYWWWAAASAVPADHPHLYAALVRAPFWIADALIALVILRAAPRLIAERAAWIYALSPLAAAVPTLHGQFEPWVLLPLVSCVVVVPQRPALAGVLLGVAIAVKPWPAFFLIPLLSSLPRRAWRPLILGTVAVPIATFALYAPIHPGHLADGLHRILTYQAHRQGFGTSLLFPDGVDALPINLVNVTAGALAIVAGVVAARGGRPRSELIALSMLILLTLSPTVSDQYLVWPLPFLLLAGRLRVAAALGVACLPAVAAVDLWTSQNGPGTPWPLFVLSTLSTGCAAVWLALHPGGRTQAVPRASASRVAVAV